MGFGIFRPEKEEVDSKARAVSPLVFHLEPPPPPVLIKMSVTAAKLLDVVHRQKVRDFVNRPLSPPDSDDEYIDVVSLTSLSASCAYWSNRLTTALSNVDPKSIDLPLSIYLPQTGKAHRNQTQPIRSQR